MENPLISAVIPVYNVEKYLGEAVESVINQSIGFDKIEIILVNDGSTDNSGEICKKYSEKYPDQIKLIEKENGGVSSARNAGLRQAKGKYVTFLDSDDKWEEHSFENMVAFFEENDGVFDVAGCRMQRFDAADNMHRLAKIYDGGSQICDVENPDDCYKIHVHGGPTFFKTGAVRDLSFDEKMKYSEDTVFVESAVLKKGKVGLCAGALYYYRRRSDFSSALQKQKEDKIYYTDVPSDYYGRLIELSKERFGKVVPYIQSCIAYDMGWRVSQPLPSILNEEEKKKYFDTLKNILSFVDDKIIIKSPLQKRISLKFAILTLKYGEDAMKKLKIDDARIMFGENAIDNFKRNKTILIVDGIGLDKKKKNIVIEGRFAAWLKASFPNGRLLLSDGNNTADAVLSPFNNKEETVFGPFERFEKFTVETVFSQNLSLEFIYDSANSKSSVYINYNPLVSNCVEDKTLFSILDGYTIVRPGRKNIKTAVLSPEKLTAAEKRRDYYIKTRNDSVYRLRKGAISSKKQIILAVGKNEYSGEIAGRLSKKHGVELYTFAAPDERYKKYYMRADKIIVFDPALVNKAVVFFGKDQVLADDALHFKAVGVFDTEPENAVEHLLSQEFILNSGDDVKSCANKIKRL